MNEALKIIDEITEQEGFTIDNDNKAEWALRKISEERAETQRFVNICNTMISEYQFKAQQAQDKLEQKTSFLIAQLEAYFKTVPKHETKTQATYKLPSGTLKLKKQQPEFSKDEEKLLTWIKANGYIQTKVKEMVDWAEFKKLLKFEGENAIDRNGEIVDGIKVVERPDKFEVEI